MKKICIVTFLSLLGFFFAAALQAADSWYAFSYFTDNGEGGMRLLISQDAMKWEPVAGGKTMMPPIGDKGIVRDPSVCRGPDGVYHMTWTMNWFGTRDPKTRTFGYASSKDLIHWSEPLRVPVMENDPQCRNVWAPEIFYDEASQKYYIIWASTVLGKFSEKGTSEDKNDHRQYFTTTTDFKTFTPSKLYFDPGHNVIDSYLAKKDGTYYLFYKDERLWPERKIICLATSKNIEGPFTPQGDISPVSWVEGPSALWLGDHWLVCYDRYTRGCYGAITSKDGKTWTDVSDQFSVPKGIRHGTMFPIDAKTAEGLKALKAE